MEKNLLQGDFDTDPFRMIKVSDLMPVGDVRTGIVYAVHKKKQVSKSQARDLFQIFETIREGAVFEGFLNIQQPAAKAGISAPITIKELLTAVNDFFIPVVNKEYGCIKGLGASVAVVERINQGFKDKLGKSAFLSRIGRHSGAEAMTIEGNRLIKVSPPEKPQKFSNDGATTIWLASNTSKPGSNKDLTPFGWVVLEVVEDDYTWPVQNCKTVKRAEDGSESGASNIDTEKEVEEETTKLTKEFNRFHSAPSPDNFIAFVKTITREDLADFDTISFKGMESAINIGVVSRLETLDVEPEILKAVALKLLEIIAPTKRWSDDKLAKYDRLKELAGR